MDTKKLEALAAAVQYGSFTRAAEALGWETPPAGEHPAAATVRAARRGSARRNHLR